MEISASEIKDRHNSLVQYISSLRNALDGLYDKYSQPQEKTLLLERIEDVELWLLSGPAEDVTGAAYEERRAILHALIDQIDNRYREAQELPSAANYLRGVVSMVLSLDLEERHLGDGPSAPQHAAAALQLLEKAVSRQAECPQSADPVLRVKEIIDKSDEIINISADAIKDLEQQEVDFGTKIDKMRQILEPISDESPLRTHCLFLLATLLCKQFGKLGKVEDINEAITLLSNVDRLMSDDHPDKVMRLNDLGIAFMTRFKSLGDISDMNAAILNQGKLVEMTPDDHADDKAGFLSNLGVSLSTRFDWLGNVEDIGRSISCHEEAVHITPDGNPFKSSFLNALGISYSTRFRRLGQKVDIDKAIASQEEALSTMPRDHPQKSGCLANLGTYLSTRFSRYGDNADIDNAIISQREAVDVASENHPHMPGYLSKFGILLITRFYRSGDTADIDKAISSLEKAVCIAPDGHPEKPLCLSYLGSALLMHFNRVGDVADLNRAIPAIEEAVRITQDGHPDKPIRLTNLGSSLLRRFDRLGDIADINKAIFYHEEAVRITPEGHPDKPGRLNNLGSSLSARFNRLGDTSDINKSISCITEAVRITPDGRPDKLAYLNNLGDSLLTRNRRLGDIADIEQAISSGEKALDITPDDHPDRPTCLMNLGASFSRRFEQLGNISDIDKAIFSQDEAVRVTPDIHPDKPIRLSGLANSLTLRFERLGSISDIDKAIFSQAEAVRLTPDDHPEKPSYLNSLGIALMMRFEHLGSLADIDKAISTQAEAVRMKPDAQPSKPGYLSNLGNSFLRRFERLGVVADIEKAIASHKEALLTTPDEHPEKPTTFTNLGNSYLRRFEQLGDLVDIDKAISNHKDAVQITPDGYPRLPGHLRNLALSFSARFDSLGDINDLKESISAYSKAAYSNSGPPSIRFTAAVSWSKRARIIDNSSVLEAYTVALSLLPRLAWVGLSIDRRYHELLSANSVACDAAATALAGNDPKMALEWLEQGRSIVWGQMLQLRTPLDELREADPELASKLARISIELERGGSQYDLADSALNSNREISAEEIAQSHRQLAQEWEDVVQRVRLLPSFEHFLQPKQYSQLREASRADPVVVLNVSTFRCDALVLKSPSEPLQHIPLKKFSIERAQALQTSLRNLLSIRRLRDRGENDDVTAPSSEESLEDDQIFRALLEELWTSVVKPVIDCLSFKQSASHNLRRMWWCPTGPLAFLPIHAAGVYPEGSARPLVSLADFAISSYTPTLSALLVALQSSAEPDIKMLTVVHPGTTEVGQLPGTEEELRFIRKRAAGFPIVSLSQSKATVSSVLSAMQTCSWAHFACHGIQDAHHPTKSGLLLEDGRLELSEIIKKPLPHAKFAFLSACQTAMGDESLPDEAIHLAAGMLLAGYRGIIATMWSIGDTDAPFVADKVYARLLRDAQPSSMNAARALHAAIQRLRNQHVSCSFASWVPYIHVGV